jgi:hypothetical protein
MMTHSHRHPYFRLCSLLKQKQYQILDWVEQIEEYIYKYFFLIEGFFFNLSHQQNDEQ